MEALETITMFRGDSYPIKIIVKDKTTGLPVPLDGYSFKLTVDTKESPPDNTTKVFEVTGVIDTPASGEVIFTPTSTNTDIAPKALVKPYYYDISYTKGAEKRTIKKERFVLVQDIGK